jgi:hypothetical protein
MECCAVGVIQNRACAKYIFFLNTKLLSVYRQWCEFLSLSDGVSQQRIA